MKIAVSAAARDLEGQVDQRFGRAGVFLLVDPESLDYEVVENKQNVLAAQGAGIQAATLLARHRVDAVITGHCGPKAFQTLRAAGIPVVLGASGSVRDVIARFRSGATPYAEAPDVAGHWE